MSKSHLRAPLFALIAAGCGGGSPPAVIVAHTDAAVDGAVADAADALATWDAPETGPARILPVVQLALPGVVLETLGAIPVQGDMRIIQDHNGTLTDLATRPLSFASRIGLAARAAAYPSGARTLTLQVRDAAGKPVTGPLLGLPYQGDWALVPCWADKTCMRNNLAFSLGAAMGMGSPRARYVEVFLNGEYQGLYQLVAPPLKGQGRIDLLDSPGAAGDALTGPYVFRREGLGESIPSALTVTDWLSPTAAPGAFPNQLIYTYVYPPPEAITAPQRDYLRDHVAKFEEAMKADAWADPAQGFPAWIDVPSWLDFAIVAEVANNVDAYWKNEVFTKTRDAAGVRGKLGLTPLWDFTIGFGNANARAGWRTDKLAFPTALASGGECADPEWLPQGQPMCDDNCCSIPFCRPPQRCWNMPYVPFYWERLQSSQAFRDQMRCRYKDLRKAGGPLDMAAIDQLITGWRSEVGPLAISRHLARWTLLTGNVFPNPYAVDPRSAPVPMASPAEFYDREVKWLRDWVAARLQWLDTNLPGVCPAAGDSPDAGAPPSPIPPPPTTVALTQGLIGYWKLDDAMGTVAKDSSPAHNDGTLMGADATDWNPMGYKQGGLTFNPAKRPDIVVMDNPSVNPTAGITIALWVNSVDWLGNRRFVQKGNGDNQYRFLEEDGVLKLHLTGVTNGTMTAVLPSNGAWHHLAGTYDGAVMRLYIDGKIVAEDVALGAIAVTANNLNIGIKSPTAPAGDSFNGVLDEVVLYNRGLDPTEIARLAAGTPPL